MDASSNPLSSRNEVIKKDYRSKRRQRHAFFNFLAKLIVFLLNIFSVSEVFEKYNFS